MGKIDFDKFLIDYVNSGFSKKQMLVNYLLEQQGLQIVKDKIVPIKQKKEPKFSNGQWIVWHDTCYKVNYNGYGYELIDQNGLSTSLEYGTIDENAHLWDITKDAKNCDILARNNDVLSICIFSHFDGINDKFGSFLCYCGLEGEGLGQELSINGYHDKSKNYVPATKKQNDTLMKAIVDAGYTFDFEKKELKKIEPKPVDWSLAHESMETERWKDACKAACCDRNYRSHYGLTETCDDYFVDGVHWADEHPKQKSTWSEEDETKLKTACAFIRNTNLKGNDEIIDSTIIFLKSLKDRIQLHNTWKPNYEQMAALRIARDRNDKIGFYLSQLYDDLKKLM